MLRTWQTARNPITDNLSEAQETEPNHNEQGREVTQELPDEMLLNTPTQPFQEEPVVPECGSPASVDVADVTEPTEEPTDALPWMEALAPPIDLTSAPAGAEPLPWGGEESSDLDAESADNAWGVIEEEVSPNLDIELEPFMEPTIDPDSEAPLKMDFAKASESIEDEGLGVTLVDAEDPFAEDPAEVATASAESIITAQVDESPESTDSSQSSLSPHEGAKENRDFQDLPTDDPFEPEDVSLPQGTEASEGLQVGAPGGYLSGSPEDGNAVDFYRESIFDLKPSTEALAAGMFSPEEELAHLQQKEFSMAEVQDNELPPLFLNENQELAAIETPDYSAFFEKEQLEAAYATPLKAENQRLPQPPEKQPISLRIRGELGTSQVPALLKLISSQKKPGTLIVHTRQGEKRFYFRKGKLSGATSIPLTKGREPNDVIISNLGQLLVRQGHLSEEQLTQALEECKQHPLRQLDALGTAGALPRETVKRALSGLITELVFSLILFPKGRFDYLAQKSPIPLQEDLGIDINALLKEASQQTIEWHELRKAIPTLDTVMEFRPNGRKKIQNAKMPRHQERIMDLIDGKRTIQNISYQAHMTEFEVCKFLFVMDKSRIISPAK
jgi:hypothetical protein